MDFRCFGNTLFPTDFTRKLKFGEAKKAKQGTGVDRKGLMNNDLKPFDQSRNEAVVPKNENLGDGVLSASSCNTSGQLPSLAPEALEMRWSHILSEKQPRSYHK